MVPSIDLRSRGFRSAANAVNGAGVVLEVKKSGRKLVISILTGFPVSVTA
jgi:hypothetical protein